MAVFILPPTLKLLSTTDNICTFPQIPPTGAIDPLLTIPPYYLVYISDEGMVGEDGRWGEDEGSSAI